MGRLGRGLSCGLRHGLDRRCCTLLGMSGRRLQHRSGLRALAQRVQHHAQHLFFRSGLADPYLKLARALLHEHLHAGDHSDALLAGEPQQRRLNRVVDQVEDVARIQLYESSGAVGTFFPANRPCQAAWR